MTGKQPPDASKGARKEPQKKLPRPDQGLIAKPSSRAEVTVGDLSNVSGVVNVAGGDVVNNIQNTIQTIYERARTPGEVAEKDLQIELNELARCVREYLDRLKQQLAAPTSSEPYKGLAAYTFSDAKLFFGREQDIRDLRQAMRRSPLTILQAESGAGKTSLLQAGILPRVIADGQLAIVVRPGTESPTQMLKNVFIGNPELTPRLSKAPLVDFLRRVCGIVGYQTTLYLILDQFEEFFSKLTLEQDRQEFIEDLAACLNDTTLNVRWVISITTDVFGQLGKFEPGISNPFSNVQSLYLLDRKEAAEVIARSAESKGLTFEDGLIDRLLGDLDQGQGEPIAPTQIQLVCAALYEDIQEKSILFSHESYTQKGGAQGILRNYLTNTLDRNLPQSERAAAYRILETLVTSEKKRMVRPRADLEMALMNKGISAEVADMALDHLVKCRLLRRLGDDDQHLQYEIVHDYLLGEIDLDEGVRRAKEAEELLDQGVRNWDKQQLLLAPDALRVIEERSTGISVSSAEARLLFLSAIQYNRPTEHWMTLISLEDRKYLAESLLAQKINARNREALWLLRRHLSGEQKTKIALARSSVLFFSSFRKLLMLVLITVAALVIALLVVTNTRHFESWTQVTGLYKACFGGNVASNLLVAIDAQDASRVVAYDPKNGQFCETTNTGAKWKALGASLPVDVEVHSVAVNSMIYVATDQGIYFLDRNLAWQKMDPWPDVNPSVERLTLGADRDTLYALSAQGRLYAYDFKSGDWMLIPVDGISGKITDISVNFAYRAVNTVDGIWYQRISSDTQWTKYIFKSDEKETVTSVRLVYPVKAWRNYFYGYDSTKDDRFLATTTRGEIFSGSLTEPQLLQKTFTGSQTITLLTVNGLSKFSERSDGLYCEQTWLILDAEWWLRFGGARPCK